MSNVAILEHNERFLTYVTRQERITQARMDWIGSFYDCLIENFQCLFDCGALNELQDKARKLLELEVAESEVIESMAESNLRMARESRGV